MKVTFKGTDVFTYKKPIKNRKVLQKVHWYLLLSFTSMLVRIRLLMKIFIS